MLFTVNSRVFLVKSGIVQSLREWALEPDSLGLNPGSTTYHLLAVTLDELFNLYLPVLHHP